MRALHGMRLKTLEQLVRPAGYFRQKARRLKIFAGHVVREYGGSLKRMLADIPGSEVHKLREELMQLPGVGKETADSILLYGGNREVFVVDTYTRRIFSRHGLINGTTDYEEIRGLAERALARGRFAPVRSRGSGHTPSAVSLMPRSVIAQRFNEMHGLLVKAGKLHCFKAMPECKGCPLESFLPRQGKD